MANVRDKVSKRADLFIKIYGLLCLEFIIFDALTADYKERENAGQNVENFWKNNIRLDSSRKISKIQLRLIGRILFGV